MIIIGHIIVISLTIIFSYRWFTLTTDIEINSESFRDSTKLGITITSLAFPLMISSSNYFTDDYFWAIIIPFSISTFLGLWNNFSIATLANGDGKITIGSSNNNLMPPFLVLQFLYMLFGIFLSLKYYVKPTEKNTEKEKIVIIHSNSVLGNTKKELIEYLGFPDSQKKNRDTIDYIYSNSKTVSTFKIYNDTIIESNEYKRNKR